MPPHPDQRLKILPTASLIGCPVTDRLGRWSGRVEELLVDMESGRIAYVVLSSPVGSLNGRLVPLPLEILTWSREADRLVLSVPSPWLEEAPGFDETDWPDVTDRSWGRKVHEHFGCQPYWKAPAKLATDFND